MITHFHYFKEFEKNSPCSSAIIQKLLVEYLILCIDNLVTSYCKAFCYPRTYTVVSGLNWRSNMMFLITGLTMKPSINFSLHKCWNCSQKQSTDGVVSLPHMSSDNSLMLGYQNISFIILHRWAFFFSVTFKNNPQSIAELNDEINCVTGKIKQKLCQNITANFSKNLHILFVLLTIEKTHN